MIIKSMKLRTTHGAKRFLDHVCRSTDNQETVILRGTEKDVSSIFDDAATAGKEFAVRHIIIAPLKPMTRNAMLAVLNGVAAEFKYDARRAFIVEHKKPRAGGISFDRHLHAVVRDSEKARIIDILRWSE